MMCKMTSIPCAIESAVVGSCSASKSSWFESQTFLTDKTDTDGQLAGFVARVELNKIAAVLTTGGMEVKSHQASNSLCCLAREKIASN